MKIRLAAICATLLLAAQGPAMAASAAPSGHILLTPPPGFEVSSSFAGYQNVAAQASILITELPGKGHFDEVAGSMTAEGMLTQGMTLIKREDITGPPFRGVAIEADQTSGGTSYHKWMRVIDAPDFVGLVTLTVPNGSPGVSEAAANAAMKSISLRADTGGDPIAALPFTISAAPRFTFRQAVAGSALMLGQTSPDVNPNSPTLLVVFSPVQAIADAAHRTAALQLLNSDKSIVVETVLSDQATTIGPLTGWEILASGKGASGQSEIFLAVYLFSGARLYHLRAMAPVTSFDEALPDFRATIASFRPKP